MGLNTRPDCKLAWVLLRPVWTRSSCQLRKELSALQPRPRRFSRTRLMPPTARTKVTADDLLGSSLASGDVTVCSTEHNRHQISR